MNIPEKDKTKINVDSILIKPECMSAAANDAVCNLSTQSPDSDYSDVLLLINERFINFENCPVGKELKKSVTIANNCGVTSTILWEEDENNIFQIHGNKTIEPFSKTAITVTFKPTKKDQIYFRELNITILWGPYLTSLNNSMNMLGNTLENPTCGWPAQYRIKPEYLKSENTISKLKLPISGPNGTSYSTFLIQREAHLPLSFSMLHPLHTRFIVSPLQGLIRGPHQIFIVETMNDDVMKNYYNKERWRIQLNGAQTHHLVIEGSREIPNLIVNNSLPVYFPTTHPLCIQKYLVKIRNPNHNMIRYKMRKTDGDCIQVDEKEYEINSNEIITNIWSFSPSSSGLYEGEVECSYHEFDLTRCLNIKFFAECEPGHLTTKPKFFSLNSVTLGCWENEVFSVINDGRCAMHIGLSCKPCSISSMIGEVYLEPQKLTIEPGSSEEVKVCATPAGLNHHDIEIGYCIRKSEESEEVIESWIPLVRFDITGEYPLFQISDIRPKIVPFLTKFDHWKILEINRLNELLKMMYLGQEHHKSNIYLPSSMKNSSCMILEIMITNQSPVSCDWDIIQEKTCDCELVEKQFGINLFKMVSVCPHKEQITLNPKKGRVKGNGVVILTLKIVYELPEEQSQTFCLKINPERMHWLSSCITIKFVRYAIPSAKPMIWPSQPHAFDHNEITFNMVPVFIGQLRPFVQAFWLYNSTPEKINYHVVPKWVQNSAFSCVNPVETVKPYSSHPLLFKFLPYELNSNKACFTLNTENKTLNIIIVCESIDMFHDASVLQMRNKMQLVSLLPLKQCHLSTDHVTLSFVPLHSTAEAIIYLNNCSDYKLVMNWQRIKLKGILHLVIIPQRDYIDPHQRILLKVACKSSSQPCLITCNLICYIEKIKSRRFIKEYYGKKDVKKDTEEVDKEFLGISITIQTNEPSLLNFVDEMRRKRGQEIIQTRRHPTRLISRDRAEIYVDVFNKIIWDIVSSKYFRNSIEKELPPVFYEEFLQNEKKEQRVAKCPKAVTEHIFNNKMMEILTETFLPCESSY